MSSITRRLSFAVCVLGVVVFGAWVLASNQPAEPDPVDVPAAQPVAASQDRPRPTPLIGADTLRERRERAPRQGSSPAMTRQITGSQQTHDADPDGPPLHDGIRADEPNRIDIGALEDQATRARAEGNLTQARLIERRLERVRERRERLAPDE